MKILCAADIHIGRESSRTSGTSAGHSALEAWKRIVELALKEKVDLVAVAGDVIDANYFQASGVLHTGLERFDQAGIHTVMIAGNHDHSTLKAFFEQFFRSYTGDKVHFLGRSDQWEHRRLQLAGGAQLDVVGRSFGAAQQLTDPFAEPLPDLESGVPALGLLHADVDQGQSRYAPCSSQQLLQAAPDVWLLGHIHLIRHFEPNGPKHVFYPGSPQALDPGESGQHGVWILQWEPGQSPAKKFHQISSVWYERLVVQCPKEEQQIATAIDHGIRKRLRELAELENPPQEVGFRIELTGRSPLHEALVRRPQTVLKLMEELRPELDSMVGFIEGPVIINTRPELNLELLAAGTSPAAILAGLLLKWERGEDDPLSQAVEDQLQEASLTMSIPRHSSVEGQENQTPVKQLLLNEGYRLLAELEANRNQRQ